jgi:hypothetical protein
MRCLGTIALVLALCTSVHAGDKVDWGPYLEKNAPATASPAKKPAQATPAKAKAKSKPVARSKPKRR